MGADVLLNGEFCLLRCQTSLVSDLLKALVLLFGEAPIRPSSFTASENAAVASLYFLTNPFFSSKITLL